MSATQAIKPLCVLINNFASNVSYPGLVLLLFFIYLFIFSAVWLCIREKFKQYDYRPVSSFQIQHLTSYERFLSLGPMTLFRTIDVEFFSRIICFML